jgi:Flp pilus assembly protein TadD
MLALAVRNAEEESLAGKSPEDHAMFHLTRGKQLMAEGRFPEAEREISEAVSLLPQDSEVHLALGRVLEVQGRHQAAAGELETSLKLKNDVAAHDLLARVYMSLNRLDAARDQCQAALSLDSANSEAQHLIDEIRQRTPPSRRTP